MSRHELVLHAQSLAWRLETLEHTFVNAIAMFASIKLSSFATPMFYEEVENFQTGAERLYALKRHTIEEAQVFVDGLLAQQEQEQEPGPVEPFTKTSIDEELLFLTAIACPGVLGTLFGVSPKDWLQHILGLMGHADNEQRTIGCGLMDVYLYGSSLRFSGSKNCIRASACRAAFLSACDAGHVDVAKRFVGIELLFPREEIAVEYQHEHVDVANETIPDGLEAAFSTALQRGDAPIVKLLLAYPRFFFMTWFYRYRTAFSWRYSVNTCVFTPAAHNGHLGVIKVLLANPYISASNCSSSIEIDINSAICEAAYYGHTAVVLALLADPRTDPAAYSNLAIHNAACQGALQTVHALLADPRVNPSSSGNRALHHAVIHGHLGVVEALLADPRLDLHPSLRNDWCACPSPCDRIFYLREGGGNAVKHASRNGHLGIVQALLADRRFDPADQDNAALKVAASIGHLGVVQALLADRRVNPAADTNAAIQFAASNGHLGVVQALLADRRVNPAANKNAAIQAAAANGHMGVVDTLLADRRVDPSANGNFAIRFSTTNGHSAITQALLADRRVDPSVIQIKGMIHGTVSQQIRLAGLLFSDTAASERNLAMGRAYDSILTALHVRLVELRQRRRRRLFLVVSLVLGSLILFLGLGLTLGLSNH